MSTLSSSALGCPASLRVAASQRRHQPCAFCPCLTMLPHFTLQGLCTPREVFVAIAAEGYQISYRRLPMSRERTPQVGRAAGQQLRDGRHWERFAA